MASPFTPEQEAYQLAHLDENKDSLIIGASVSLIVLSTVAIILRFVARLSRRLEIGIDDWFALVAWVFSIPINALNIAMIQWGLGRHTLANDPTVVWKVIQNGIALAMCYSIVHWWIKLSILFFYRRIFSFRKPWFKWSCVACGIYATAWTLATFFVTLFQCFPVEHFWNQLNPALDPPSEGSCPIDNAKVALATSALNSLLDIVIFILPIIVLWNLQMKQSRRLLLIGVFATGAFAIAAGLFRVSNSYLSVKPGADATWIVADVFLWTAAEASVGLICACLPIIGPLCGMVRDNVRSYLSKQSLNSNSGAYNFPLQSKPNSSSGSVAQLTPSEQRGAFAA